MKYYVDEKKRNYIIKKTRKGFIFKRDTVEKRKKEKIQITNKDIIISYIPEQYGIFDDIKNVKYVIPAMSIKGIIDNVKKHRYELICDYTLTTFNKNNEKNENTSRKAKLYIYKYFNELDNFATELQNVSKRKIIKE